MGMSLALQQTVWLHFPSRLAPPTNTFCSFQMFILLTASHPVLQELLENMQGSCLWKRLFSQTSDLFLGRASVLFGSCKAVTSELTACSACSSSVQESKVRLGVVGRAAIRSGRDAALAPASSNSSASAPWNPVCRWSRCSRPDEETRFVTICSSGSAALESMQTFCTGSYCLHSLHLSWEMVLFTVFC